MSCLLARISNDAPESLCNMIDNISKLPFFIIHIIFYRSSDHSLLTFDLLLVYFNLSFGKKLIHYDI